MLISYRHDQDSIILRVKILDSSVSTGAGKTGLSHTSSGLVVATIADSESSSTAYTQAAGNLETITTLGTYAAPTAGKCRFKEVDSTNHKGVYEIHLADARYAASSAKSLLVSISGASDAAETDVLIPLTTFDPYAAIPWNPAWDAEVQSEVNDGLVALHLDHLLAVDYDPASPPGVATALLNELVEDDAGVSRFTANALEQAPGGGGGDGSGFTAIPWNPAWDAEVQSEVDDALVARGLDHLINVAVTGTDVADNSIVAQLVSASATADWDDFVNTTDSLQAIRDADVTLADGVQHGGTTATLELGTSGTRPALNIASSSATQQAIKVLNTNATSGNAIYIASTAQHAVSLATSGAAGNAALSLAAASGGDGLLLSVSGGGSDVAGELVAANFAASSLDGKGDWNTTTPLTAAQTESEVNDALVALGLDHLVNVAVTGTDVADNSIVAQLVSASATADWDDFVNTTDSLQAVRDRGDAAWATATGFMLSSENGSSFTAIPWNSAWDAEVQSEVNDGLVALHLDHLLAVDYDPASPPGVATALLNELVEDDAGVSRFTANALEQAPGGGGGDGSGFTAIPWNPAWDAEVQSEVDDALVARGLDHLINVAVTGTDVADNSIVAQLVSASATADWDDFVNTTDSLQAVRDRGDAAWATATGFMLSSENGSSFTAIPWNSAWDAEVQSEVNDGLVALHLDHLLAVDYDPASPPGVATALLNELVEDDAGVSRFTANALEQAPGGGGASTVVVAATAVALQAIDAAGKVTIHRGDEVSFSITGLGSLSGRSGEKLYFTAKRFTHDEDTNALLQISETTGLIRVNGAAGTAGNASITVTDESNGDITVTVKSAATALLPALLAGKYDVQIVKSTGEPATLAQGEFAVTPEVTHS